MASVHPAPAWTGAREKVILRNLSVHKGGKHAPSTCMDWGKRKKRLRKLGVRSKKRGTLRCES
eukprot:1161463-Pelagomonas_calceolata.AAC.3